MDQKEFLVHQEQPTKQLWLKVLSHSLKKKQNFLKPQTMPHQLRQALQRKQKLRFAQLSACIQKTQLALHHLEQHSL